MLTMEVHSTAAQCDPNYCILAKTPFSLVYCRLQEGPRLASFVAWALPRAAGVRELTVRFTNHHQAMKFQVSVTPSSCGHTPI